jgi:hypothetical protein
MWFACGWELPMVMEAAGHSDPSVTTKIYSHVMNRNATGARERLKALVIGDTLEGLAEPRLASGQPAGWTHEPK